MRSPKEVIGAADLVTEMAEVKHYYEIACLPETESSVKAERVCVQWCREHRKQEE